MNFNRDRIFAQESIARMNGIGIGNLSRADHRRNIKIAERTLSRTNANCFIREPDMEAMPVGLRIDCYGFDSKIAARTDNAQRNLAPIGNKNFSKHALRLGRPYGEQSLAILHGASIFYEFRNDCS